MQALAPQAHQSEADQILSAHAQAALLRQTERAEVAHLQLARRDEVERALRGAGTAPPAERIRAAFGLGEVAVELLLLLAAAEVDARVWATARSLHRDPTRTGIDCASAE